MELATTSTFSIRGGECSRSFLLAFYCLIAVSSMLHMLGLLLSTSVGQVT